MKIIFVLPDMPGGGTERVVAILANEYVKRGFLVTILLFAGDDRAYPLDDRIEICVVGRVSKGNPLIQLKRLLKMRRFYKKNKDCYIFSFSAMGTVFSVIAAAGIPHSLLVSERNDPTRYSHRKLRDWAYKKADRIVFQTEDMKEYFSEEIKSKSTVIPNPVAENMPKPFRGERKKRIVSVARLQPQKNHKLLLDAFAEFLKEYSEYELHLFGKGELEEKLKIQAKELGIFDKVIFRGFSPNVKGEIWDSAMFVLSSDYEGISNSMIEALAMGIPVISTDCPVGGSRAYIKNQINGILVPVGDRQALAEAMKQIAGNEQLANKLSENGTVIKEIFSLNRIANRFLEESGIRKMKNDENTNCK